MSGVWVSRIVSLIVHTGKRESCGRAIVPHASLLSKQLKHQDARDASGWGMGRGGMSNRPAAFVTGGRRSIGRAICWALAEGGFDIVVNDIVEDEAVGDTLSGIEARGGHATFLRGDVGDLDGHEGLVRAAWAAFGGIDCLVNN